MTRLDRARLEAGVFPRECRVVTRFADRDERGHLSDVAVAKTFEEGRYRMIQSSGVSRPLGYQRVIAGTLLEYAAPMSHPAPVDVSTGILGIGRKSFRLGQIARQNGRIGAYAEVAVVLRDATGPVPLLDEWRARFDALRIDPGAGVQQAARLDRARLENRAFAHRCEVTTRFADMDRLGHLNNVALAEILQEGRFRFCNDLGMVDTTQRRLAVASTFVEYAGDLFYPDPVEVATAVLDVGRTSFRIGQIVIQNGRTGVYAEAVQVLRDGNGPIPLPDDWRARLQPTGHGPASL